MPRVLLEGKAGNGPIKLRTTSVIECGCHPPPNDYGRRGSEHGSEVRGQFFSPPPTVRRREVQRHLWVLHCVNQRFRYLGWPEPPAPVGRSELEVRYFIKSALCNPAGRSLNLRCGASVSVSRQADHTSLYLNLPSHEHPYHKRHMQTLRYSQAVEFPRCHAISFFLVAL